MAGVGSKNCLANRGASLVVYCPECEEKMKLCMRVGYGPNGRFWECTSCAFTERFYQKSYKKYNYNWTKGK
jgi:Zn ribbon nucleic-acid-binding protein